MTFHDLTRPQAIAWYDDLLARGGYGRLPRECAAFLIRESDGSLTLAPWPGSAYHRASVRGRVPDGAIAILHTHPREEPSPSRHDRQEARRLQMPVLVITPSGVIAAMPEGALATISRRGAGIAGEHPLTLTLSPLARGEGKVQSQNLFAISCAIL
jgi:proteasome lid subunit RPN8/RPN11